MIFFDFVQLFLILHKKTWVKSLFAFRGSGYLWQSNKRNTHAFSVSVSLFQLP